MTDYSNPELSLDALFKGVKVSPWEVEKNLALPLFSLEDPKRYQELTKAIVEGWREAGTKALNSKSQGLYACDCAERVLSLFESEFPEDKRPRKAIEVARLYTEGQATSEELRQAGIDAGAAAAAAWAARESEREAAQEAARASWAAWAARSSAAAAKAASEAAWAVAAAARAVAAAARAAWEAAEAAEEQEKQWQANRVRYYFQMERP